MRFTTEVLPLLADAPRVTVEVSGAPTEYREAGDSVQIDVSTTDVGDTDWFDLGVRITVEARQVPFAEVFVALAAGESHLLLADGAYFARPYQREGFGWLAFLWRHRLGGVLADDMGLGKTLQSLALISHAKQADPVMAPFLIVAPTSVASNWAAEAPFAPDPAVVTVTDTLRRRGQELPEVIDGADVVVSSYTLFRLDAEAYTAAGWSGLLLDEAQFTKNHQSKIYQCARRLPAPFKLAITGTPMENNLMELWSLLSNNPGAVRSRWPPTCPLSRNSCSRWSSTRSTAAATSATCNASG